MPETYLRLLYYKRKYMILLIFNLTRKTYFAIIIYVVNV